MNVFFDARWARLDTIDGITRYTAELIAAVHALHPVTMIIYDKRQLAQLPKDVPHVLLNSPFAPTELLVAHKLNRLGADVVFSPMQVMGTWGRKYKLIFTLHDLIYYQHRTPPTHIPQFARGLWWLFHSAYWPQRILLNQADAIATVSETSRQEMLRHHLTKRPVEVIGNAPSDTTKLPRAKISKELVYMGSFMPYKNVTTLVDTMSLLPGYTLHLASYIHPAQESALQARITNPAQVKFWHGASDQQYAALLSRATALVTASKSEGFGLPLVEAMQAGVPVICSDIPIFHEVGGDAAIYIDPDSPRQLAEAVRALESPQAQHLRSALGKTQAATYTWRQSGKTLIKLMRHLTGTTTPD